MKKLLKITTISLASLLGLLILIFLAWPEKAPKEDTYIVQRLSEQYPTYSVRTFPAFLDAAIEVTHSDGSDLNEQELADVRKFFDANYSGGYWRGIRK